MGVALVAAVLRFWRLGSIPPGFQFDEAFNGLDALAILAGRFEMFFPANGGREPLLAYLEALSLSALGADGAPFALRVVSTFAGILTVAALVPVMGILLGERRAGLYAAAFLAVSFWHVHFSRYAIRAILAPLWTVLALGAWWSAVHAEPDRRWALAAAVASGVFMAVALYSHPTGRLVPVIVALHWAARMLTGSAGARRRDTLVAATTAGTAVLVSLPLLAHFARYPALFTSHPSDVSIQAVAAAQHGGSLAAALAANGASIAGMFLIRGDPSTFHNLPGLPVFDGVTGLLAVLGVGVLGAMLLRGSRSEGLAPTFARFDAAPRERAGFLLLWVAVMLTPTLLSDRPPNYSRAIAALPALVVLPALGTLWAERALSARALVARGSPGRRDDDIAPIRRRGGPVPTDGWNRTAAHAAARWLAPAAIVWGAAWTVWHLGAFSRLDHVAHSYDVHIMDAYADLARRSKTADVYLHPLWGQHATFAYLNRAGPVRVLDGTGSMVVRDRARPVEIAFAAEQEDAIEAAEALLATAGAGSEAPLVARADVADGRGDPLLTVFRVQPTLWGDMSPPTDAPLEPREWRGADFGLPPRVRLMGYSVGTARAGEPLSLDIWWESLADMSANLTTFVHVTDSAGRAVGQVDREPAKASHRTGDWEPGELVLERFQPVVDPGAQGPLTIEVGWYDASTGDRLARTGREGGVPVAPGTSTVTIGPIEVAQ